MPTQEISDYVTGLSSATLTGAEEVYLATDKKTTVNAISQFAVGKVYKAQISQTGTSAPTLVELVNTLGVTVTPAYGGVGDYSISGFDSNLSGLIDVSITTGFNESFTTEITCQTSSILNIATYISGASSNDVLSNSGTYIGTCVVTVTKYD